MAGRLLILVSLLCSSAWGPVMHSLVAIQELGVQIQRQRASGLATSASQKQRSRLSTCLRVALLGEVHSVYRFCRISI
jgi:hypothetical protein